MAKTDECLNMSSTEVEMWISSDELNVTAEEDVFEFILAWIEHNKVDRKKYFFTLFRHVRVVCVSRDYFRNNIVTNKLVMSDKDCFGLVEEILRPNESERHGRYFHLKTRKSLEVPVIVISERQREGNKSLCYFPREDACYSPPDGMPSVWDTSFSHSCHDQLYFQKLERKEGINVSRYDTFFNASTSLRLKQLDFLLELLVTS